MKAIHLSYDRKKLRNISRELFLEHGWKMPAGLARDSERDPLNYTLAEWQQARRTGQHPKTIKAALQDAWAISDNKTSYVHALAERGFKLARGDRGRFIAVDVHGEAYSVPRQTNITTKDARERLGSGKDLPSYNEAKAEFAAQMSQKIDAHKAEHKKSGHIQLSEMKEDKQRLIEIHRQERKAFINAIHQRSQTEALERQARFRTGLGGVWDRLRGHHKRIEAQNTKEAADAQTRDALEKDQLIQKQLSERRGLVFQVGQFRKEHKTQERLLNADQSKFEKMKADSLKAIHDETLQNTAEQKPRRRSRSPAPQRVPKPEL